MATQTVNKNTNIKFHSFGRGSEHIVSLDESLSSAPYLVTGLVRPDLGLNNISYEQHTTNVSYRGALTGLIQW